MKYFVACSTIRITAELADIHRKSAFSTNCKRRLLSNSKTLITIIRHKIKPDSIVYTDCEKTYNAFDVSDLLDILGFIMVNYLSKK